MLQGGRHARFYAIPDSRLPSFELVHHAFIETFFHLHSPFLLLWPLANFQISNQDNNLPRRLEFDPVLNFVEK